MIRGLLVAIVAFDHSNESDICFFMIRRLFTLLLVFLMLANQGLCLAHVHHANELAEPEGHAARPHFHVGGHVHRDRAHDHQHADDSHPDHLDSVPDSGNRGATFSPATSTGSEHDSDAVYCGESVTIARIGNSVDVLPDNDVAGIGILHAAIQDDGSRHIGPLRCQPPSVLDAACPIYLRTLSLRI